MTEAHEQQFEQDYDQFLEAGFLFVARDQDGRWTLDEALRRLRFYVRLYIEKNNANISSVSAFKIVADALASGDEIRPIVRTTEEPEENIPDLTAEEYRSIPVRTIQMRYKSDPDFKRQVESLIARGLI
jgi:hypothetical protein